MIFGTERHSIKNFVMKKGSIAPNDFDATTYIPIDAMSKKASPVAKKKLDSMSRLPELT